MMIRLRVRSRAAPSFFPFRFICGVLGVFILLAAWSLGTPVVDPYTADRETAAPVQLEVEVAPEPVRPEPRSIGPQRPYIQN